METEPRNRQDYDLIVIGTGNAGMRMALDARHAGWRVAIVDERPYGGTCALRGCVPKKVLTGAAELIERTDTMRDRGISGNLSVDWPDLIRFKRTFTDPVPSIRENIFKKEGIEAYHGHARFIGTNTLSIGEDIRSARFIGIATGAIPRVLSIPGEEYVSTSDEFLALESLPQRIIFIGGGFISFELANVAAKAGSTVTILHRSGKVMKGFDPFLVELLVQNLRESGILILTDHPVTSIEKKSESLRVHAGNGERESFDADMVIHGAGRVPNLEGLDLERGGVFMDERGIVINQYLQSVSNPSVYVAGDVNGRGRPLSPVATMEGRTAAKNMIHGNTHVPSYTAVPGVVFTSPPLASVGLHEDQAAKHNVTPLVHQQETSDWYSNRRVGISRSGYKILTDPTSGRILGAHLLGYNVDEMINIFALAIGKNISLDELRDMVWAYPTAGYDIIRIR